MSTLPALWPVHDLRIRCATTELRVLREADIADLLALKAAGIVSPACSQPFIKPWHRGPDRTCVEYWYQMMAASGRPDYTLTFVVRDSGVIVGIQDVIDRGARSTRSLETASWLARAYHGQGIGTRMRQMVVAFGFDQLDMEEMRSAAHSTNVASCTVSLKCGYREDGTHRIASDGGHITDVRYVVTPQTFVRPRDPISYTGVAEFKDYVHTYG